MANNFRAISFFRHSCAKSATCASTALTNVLSPRSPLACFDTCNHKPAKFSVSETPFLFVSSLPSQLMKTCVCYFCEQVSGKKDALTLSRTVLEWRVGRRSMRNKDILMTPRLEAVTKS